MSIDVTFTQDPALVLGEAEKMLRADRARNNMVLALLTDRAETGEPGRYWVAEEQGDVRGVVFQSPLNFSALVTPMQREVVAALVKRIHSDGVQLPGVGFEVETTSAFAGEWAARAKCAIKPTRLGRQYECFKPIPPQRQALGEMRLALPDERELMVDWLAQFLGVVGGPDTDVAQRVDRALATDRLYAWDDGGPVSMSVLGRSLEGITQIGIVFTPPEHRGKGYASACVAELTAQVLASGHRCMLYANLNNPTANHVYQQIGYEVVQETLQLEFE